MGSKGWIKRVLPFFAAFAVGVFIASLFGFGGPRFGRHGRGKLKHEIERLRAENEELKNENLRLKNNWCVKTDDAFEFHGIPSIDPPTMDELPPPPPRPHRHPGRDR